jgi:hypothetical protein
LPRDDARRGHDHDPTFYGERMETIVDRVVAAAGRYEGAGHGAESGAFTAAAEIRAVLDGMGATIDYVATDPAGTIVHREHTLLAFDMWSGEATLYVLCAELSGLGQLVQVSETTFNNGRGTVGLELQIELSLDDGLEYVWSWGAPGEPLSERSRAKLAAR